MRFFKYLGISLWLVLFLSAAKKLPEQITARYIDKRMVEADSMLYACKFETTNWEYRTFLREILKSKDLRYYKESLWDTTVWSREKLRYGEPMMRYYQRHPNYNEFPVVGITWKGAQNFCNWLTEKYNEDPKRKFKEVVFKLPSEQEWVTAARGTNKHACFPWDDSYPIDSEVANFKTLDQTCIRSDTNDQLYLVCSKDDTHKSSSFVKTVKVGSYKANSIGLYDMAGNVSEMLERKGLTKGGSWNSTAYYLQVDVENEYGWDITKGSSMLGFRYFMLVINE